MKRFLLITLLLLVTLLLFVSSVASKRGSMAASADLSLTKVDTPDPVNAGGQLTYTITVTNDGPDPAADATWSDTLPAGIFFHTLSNESGWSCSTPADGDTGTISCSNPSFSVGSSVFTLTVTASSNSTPGSIISNTATVASSTADPNPGNESGTATTTVLSPSIIQGNKSVSGDVSPGSTVTYTIGLTNLSGSAQADNPGAEFTDVLPADLTLVSADASSGTATANIGTNTVTWNGRIEGSDSVTITIAATINSGTTGNTVTNQGTINYDADGNGTNESTAMTNSSSFMVGPASNVADLLLTKSGPSQVHSDTDVTYTITVTNLSSNAATNAQFSDTLPGSVPGGFGMTFVSFSQTSGPVWNCGSPSATTSCSIATLPAGTSSVFSFVGHVPSGPSDGSQYTNETTVFSDADPNSENNTGSAVTTVSSCFTDQVVTSNADSGAGTLRQAIIDACDGGTIGFDMAQVVSPINLASVLSINKTLTFQGPGATQLTISGNNTTQIFDIASGSANVTIADLQLANSPTTAIRHNGTGTLTITNAVIAHNGAAISAGGGININAGGSLNVTNSTFDHNSAQSGGGICNLSAGALTISGSTFSFNSVSNSGGGGGIFNSQGALTITNSTFSNNSTNPGSGAAIFTDSTAVVDIVNTTISNNQASGNGGGIQTGATAVQLRNTIVAGNSATANGQDVIGTFTSNGHNLIGKNDFATGFTNGMNGDIVGNISQPVDARLGPLANNGGMTQTLALLAGSPALDAGDNCVTDSAHCSDANISQLTTDQRGVNRMVDSQDVDTTDTVDIGAFEAQVSVEDIPDKSTNEDTQLQFTFKLGGSFTSVTATSSNTALVPNNAANIALSGSGSTRTLTINPAANLFGTSTITVSVNANSQTMTDTFVLTVNSVNDVPSFTKGPNQTVNEDAATQAVTNWATNISVGPANESEQVPTFMVTGNTNPSLFSVAPAISSNGTLSYTPATDANGSATITIVLQDDGGTANGGQNTSASQTFTITVNSVNDAPSFTKGSDQTVLVNAGAQTVTNWATNISAGPSDETGQTLTFQVTGNTNSALFSAQPAISSNGTLTFTPATNINGSATITINLKDNGGTANGGVDTSATQTFTITVNCGSTIVTNSNDSGAGSLRDTILHACTGATITFDMNKIVSQINLTTGQLTIDNNLTIQGPGADTLTVLRSIAGATPPQFRVFAINSGRTVSISGLTIANGNLPNSAGNDGAGILNQGTLALSACEITANTTARSGGGVANSGPSGIMTITGCTIFGNTASAAGGGIANGGTLTVTNSTFVNNNADGLSNSSPGVVTLINDTFSGNGRGISNNAGAPVNIGNTIVANSNASAADVSGSFNSLGNNLIATNPGGNGFTNGVNGDKTGAAGAVLNPRLGSLTINGGTTRTFALLPGSPAIDAGRNAAITNPPFSGPPFTDQRGTGFNRIVNGTVDIGAFESRGFTISMSSGSPQSATILSAFASPLIASITGVGGEPVNGGIIIFTAPAANASAVLTGGGSTATVTIAGGQASTNATANGTAGSYNVVASTNGATPASFALTNNKAATNTTIASSVNPSDFNQNVTFTATVTSVITPTGTVQFKDNGVNFGAPTALNASGVAQITTGALTVGNHTITADFPGSANFQPSTASLTQTVIFRSLIKFSQANYSVNENGKVVTITVVRTNDTSQPATVDFSTPDDSAAMTFLPCSNANGVGSPRCDFTTTMGTLRFAAGETTKTFDVLISQDLWVEGNETVQLTLSNPTSAVFQQPSDAAAVLTIVDDDTSPPSTNAIDDSTTFVRQHYHDFLNREPDTTGLNFWVNQIESCGADAQCRAVKRINVSAAFFLSIEFQNTGYFVERVHKTAFGDIAPPTVPVPIRFTTFLADSQQITNGVIVGVGNWQAQLDANKKAFALAFVQRAAFLNRYPAQTSATAFVDSLNSNAGMVLSDSERSALIAQLTPNPTDPAQRADVLMKVAENAVLQQREFNRAFVLMQYFGYLRRNPDAAPESTLNFNGYNFWLNKLNQFNGDYIGAELIKAFITSGEYRGRFGP